MTVCERIWLPNIPRHAQSNGETFLSRRRVMWFSLDFRLTSNGMNSWFRFSEVFLTSPLSSFFSLSLFKKQVSDGCWVAWFGKIQTLCTCDRANRQKCNHECLDWLRRKMAFELADSMSWLFAKRKKVNWCETYIYNIYCCSLWNVWLSRGLLTITDELESVRQTMSKLCKNPSSAILDSISSVSPVTFTRGFKLCNRFLAASTR
jgi:hypothetical protein